jgi:hypothetical protein
MRGWEISGNIAQSGGGVGIEGGTFAMMDGEISGNIAQSGGGVLVEGGEFTMTDGAISGNDAAMFGGGAMLNTATGGKFIKTGGTIDAANSAGTGSAVYVYDRNGSRKRDTTAGPDVNLDSEKYGGAGGWE